MTIEPFGLTCAIRIIVMFAIFALASKFIWRMLVFLFGQQVLCVLVLGALSGAFSLLLAGGYCVGFLGAISVAFLIECGFSWKQMKPRHMIVVVMWAAAALGSIAVYISFAAEGTTGLLQNGTSLVAYLKGFLVYLGGAIVSQHYAEETVTRFKLGGLAVFVAAMATGVVYLRLMIGKRSYMPLLLMLYAAIFGVVIVVPVVSLVKVETMREMSN